MGKFQNHESFKSKKEKLEYIRKIVDNLEKSVNKRNYQKCLDIYNWLSISYFEFFEIIPDIIDVFSSTKILEITYSFLTSDYFKDQETMKKAEDLLTFLINFSADSRDFSKQIFKNKIQEWVIDKILINSYSNKMKITECMNIYQLLLRLIHNVAVVLENDIEYKFDDFLNNLKDTIFKCEEDYNGVKIKLFCSLILSYMLVGKDVINKESVLDIGKSSVTYLVEMSKNLNSADKRYQGFKLGNILFGLQCLCVTSELKNVFCNCGGIDTVIDHFNENRENNEIVEPALEILVGILFTSNSERRQLLQTNKKLLDIAENFKSEHKNIQRLIGNMKDQINKTGASKEGDATLNETKEKKYDIFISYCHKNKRKVEEVKSKLLENNYKIWYDEDEMEGDIYQSMALGIQNSKIILVNISRDYVTSVNCRKEATYAQTLNKDIIPLKLQSYHPTDWLGLLIAGKMYYEVSDRKNTFDQMNLEITKLINHSGVESQGPANEQRTKKESVESLIKERLSVTMKSCPNKDEECLKTWTNKDVSSWLINNNLKSYVKQFKTMNGLSLLELNKVRIETPEFFNSNLKSDFKMNLTDIINFRKALDNLFSGK